jgi:SAM-dependent methyltransferase
MSNENTSIHDYDLTLITEYFSMLERQGPGSPATTLKALRFIDPPKDNFRVLDIGCGNGSHTMVLADNTRAQITGLDLFPLFINQFNEKVQTKGLGERVKGITGDMQDLPFEKASFDLIWSEGAIYNIGFERGLKEWREFLKPGGFIAISEATWFTPERPEEIYTFWKDAYPGIDTISSKMSQVEKAGYKPLASFVLPDECWTTNFYDLQEEIRETFLDIYSDNPAAKAFVENEKHEAELYRKYKDYYGYTFFIARKI